MPKPFKCVVKRNLKEHNEFSLNFTGMTAGKILALRQALAHYAMGGSSPVASDVYDAVEAATQGDILKV